MKKDLLEISSNLLYAGIEFDIVRRKNSFHLATDKVILDFNKKGELTNTLVLREKRVVGEDFSLAYDNT